MGFIFGAIVREGIDREVGERDSKKLTEGAMVGNDPVVGRNVGTADGLLCGTLEVGRTVGYRLVGA